MKLVRQSKLHFRQGTSDKVYEVDLCEAGAGEFLVNYRYGRRGADLREGTKTPFPTSRAKAEGIFDSLVAEKTRKGYLIAGGSGIAAAQPAAMGVMAPASDDPRRSAVVKRLADEATGRAPAKAGWRLSRVIWRTGAWRMRETADSIAALVPALKTEMDFWCAAWALGRCGEARHVVALELIGERAKSFPWILAMVAEARAALLPDEETASHFSGPLGEAWKNQEAAVFKALLEQELRGARLGEQAQRELILLTARHNWVREVVYELVRSLPIQRGTMQFFRQVLKSAEFRMDAELYGQVVRRFELAKGNPSARWRRKGTPPTAFTTTTRNYFRRRVIRHLKTAGESGEAGLFIPLATGLLVAFDDELDSPEKTSTYTYQWNPQTRRSDTVRIWFPRYSSCLGFIWLLRGGGDAVEMNPLKTGWKFLTGRDGEQTKREEPFAELWDQAPDAIMHLLRHARSLEAQQFALRVWRANPSFIDEATGELVADLLASWCGETVALGLEIARLMWDPAEPDLKLLLGMLDSALAAARTQGVAWLRDASGLLAGDGDFLSGVAFLLHEDARVALREVLRSAPLTKAMREEVVARVVSGLLALDDETSAGVATDWLEFIAPEETAALPVEHLAALASHPLEACQLLAIRVMLRSGSPGELPESLLLAAISSEFPTVRKLGMALLGKLRDDELAQRVQTLAACAVSPHEELREASAPLLARAATHGKAAARELVGQWYPLLFRKEPFEGLHASIYNALSGSFAYELDVIPPGSFRKMLESRYGYGQMLGFEILKRQAGTAAVEDLVEWSVHELAALREWARGRLEGGALRSDPALVLKLLEGPYEDSREWAFSFCRDHLSDGDWSPEALVAVCDSTNQAARAFGRELVTRLFREEDGPLYLARLSQHPSVEVQLFATNYLERFASGAPERIAGLDRYFRTVLSRIGAGRVAKQRVLAFLEKEALADQTVAAQVNALLGRQAGTVAIQDKAEMIRILNTLRLAWPELEGPLKVKTVEVYQPS